ncbi:MAG: hypothetical protein L0L93_08885 [Brevibacterium sp.]|uniref:hypothetical protein n=1 Tax=Brevibacterium sp. TaxID=1701 RepID=UPI00264A0A88|nr:hypothetical protein [Brevibacterium sp.]MDN5806233.1 hypothetical protein [Brevibacterium sp.]MDN5875404.1 hypothetical protein [Brevibacterium sp.]MDN5908562.1 hypothetical protein [Brevibacterium sp.]MDN6133082.1 hypothetical protein [Brevibacterium sp.]MDN6157538.1 hypothetical protein [Brevibacterium sp.]
MRPSAERENTAQRWAVFRDGWDEFCKGPYVQMFARMPVAETLESATSPTDFTIPLAALVANRR